MKSDKINTGICKQQKINTNIENENNFGKNLFGFNLWLIIHS